MARLDLGDLQLFRQVAEAGSITAGAARANLALAAASTRLRGMEAVLGTALLERSRSGVVMTPAGEALLTHARALLAGAVLTESVFAFNGIGSYLFDAISSLDFAVLQGFILFIAVVYALVNLVVDIGYGVIDPRLRTR